ncbi:MAG: hypothetical protein ACP5VE_04005 [Chthonomonadales bacterium]
MAMGPFLNKWLHLVSIIFVLGGVLYQRFVAIPALRTGAFSDTDWARSLARRWGVASALLWLIILVTGFVNFHFVAPHVNSTYAAVLGMKILLALVMFFLAMAVSHPMPFAGALHRQRNQVLVLLALLGVVVVGMSAYLNLSRINGTGLRREEPAPPSVSAPQALPTPR